MPLKEYKPNTPGMRYRLSLDYSELDKKDAEKALRKGQGKNAGRDSNGRISVRRRGGGNKRAYRQVDFKRDKENIPATVVSIEYDPNRSANIALVAYADGEKRYILAPVGLAVDDTVMSGPEADITPGNALPLANIPLGTHIHNVELRVGKGGQIVRSAGVFAQLMAKEDRYAQVKLPSGEVRMVLLKCMATVGQVGNVVHENISLGKAGRKRWRGCRPKVRGVAMNPVDHPMGGGEGRSSGGRHPCSPWGVPAKGYRTRKNKGTDRYIVRRRSKK